MAALRADALDISGPARRRRVQALVAMSGIAIVVLAADQISKTVALNSLPGRQPVRILGGLLTLRLTHNAGAAFSVGTSYTAMIAVIACTVIVVIIRTARRLGSVGWAVGLGLVLGGAAGNFCDRLFRAPGVFRGRVVDWINLPHFPWTFNLADSAITCAAVLIVLLVVRGIGIEQPPAAATLP